MRVCVCAGAYAHVCLRWQVIIFTHLNLGGSRLVAMAVVMAEMVAVAVAVAVSLVLGVAVAVVIVVAVMMR